MKNFEVVPAPSLITGGKPAGGERTETTAKRFRVRNNRTLETLPKLYDSAEQAQAECDRLDAE